VPPRATACACTMKERPSAIVPVAQAAAALGPIAEALAYDNLMDAGRAG
jgi:hypothetical protein